MRQDCRCQRPNDSHQEPCHARIALVPRRPAACHGRCAATSAKRPPASVLTVRRPLPHRRERSAFAALCVRCAPPVSVLGCASLTQELPLCLPCLRRRAVFQVAPVPSAAFCVAPVVVVAPKVVYQSIRLVQSSPRAGSSPERRASNALRRVRSGLSRDRRLCVRKRRGLQREPESGSASWIPILRVVAQAEARP